MDQDRTLAISAGELEVFRRVYNPGSEVANRISILLWIDLFVCSREFGVPPPAVTREIAEMESGKKDRRTKAATPFIKKPLKGLWHKHFYSGQFIPKNLSLSYRNGQLYKIVREVLDSGSTSPDVLAAEISRRAVHEQLEKRAAEEALTGEWIIFAKHEWKNYYLFINTHI